MSTKDPVQRSAQGGNIQAAAQARAKGDVLCAACTVYLGQEPKPLLCVRKRKRLIAVDRGNGLQRTIRLLPKLLEFVHDDPFQVVTSA